MNSIALWELLNKTYNGKIAIEEGFNPPTSIDSNDVFQSLINKYPTIKPLIFSYKKPEGFVKAKNILGKDVSCCENPDLYLIGGYSEFFKLINILLNTEDFVLEEGVSFQTVYDTFDLINYIEISKLDKEVVERLKRINSNIQSSVIYYHEMYNPSKNDILIIQKIYEKA